MKWDGKTPFVMDEGCFSLCVILQNIMKFCEMC